MKPLIIQLNTPHKEGNREVWNDLQNPENFVGDITTPDLDTDHTNINQVVSGLPNPFARAVMFQFAIEAAVDNRQQAAGGMMSYYEALRDEWKGLIGCIALDSAPIKIDSIPLAYADGNSFDTTKRLYEVGGALGNMLFEDRKYWCDAADWRNNPTGAVPHIHVIRYHGTIIGATAPKSLFFTPPVYKIQPRVPFYLHDRFQDPLQSELTEAQTQILYTYVSHICENFHHYHDTLDRNGKSPDTTALLRFLGEWKTEIWNYGLSKSYNISDHALATNINIFPAPFDTLFNTTVKLYGFNGDIFREPGPNRIEFDPSELLIPHDSSTLVRFNFEKGQSSAQNAAYLISATSEDGPVYFSIPLSEKGILIFQNSLNSLIGDQFNGNQSHLVAHYDKDADTVNVELKLMLDGQPTVIERTYRKPISISAEKVILWPNFYSPDWDAYFYYSEMPHNGNGSVRTFPLQADLQDYLLLNQDGAHTYLINPEKIDEMRDTGKFMVRHNEFFNSNPLQYEIIKSDLPLKGIELRIAVGAMNNQLAGYVLARSKNAVDDFAIENKGKIALRDAKVGFDFGSNNICVSYAAPDGKLNLIHFQNRLRFLVGTEQANPDNKRPAKPYQVFFFQARPIKGNEIKSMVMIHDRPRVVLDSGGKPSIGQEVSGGLPVFELNLPVENSENNTHEVNFGQTSAKIKYNMKWSTDADENQFKYALLKTIWLKVQAELFSNQLKASHLSWAYPSAMSSDIVQGYSNLWTNVVGVSGLAASPAVKVSPVDSEGQDGALTEAEAVCNFAMTGIGGMEARPNYLIFGFDVGGSTTDILCIHNPDEAKLIKQSSVRLSAGLLAEATRQSANIRSALQTFCGANNIFIYGIQNQLTENTAPYFFNAVLDRLAMQGDDKLNLFYSNIFAGGCRDIFVVNAYLTGLLFYYAGQLAAKVIANQEEGQPVIDTFQFGFYGKGGRMFDWLPAIAGGGAKRYYQECFSTGLGKSEGFNFEIMERVAKGDNQHHVKSEVSFGLAATRRVNVNTDQLSELVGEQGYSYNGQPLESLSDVEKTFFRRIGQDLSIPPSFVEFEKFLNIFTGFAKRQFAVQLDRLKDDVQHMKLANYITNLPEYKSAVKVAQESGNDEDFGFEAPLIVLEGMCFLENTLMKKVFQ